MDTPLYKRFPVKLTARLIALMVVVAGLAGLHGKGVRAFEPTDICPNPFGAFSGTIPADDPDGAEYVICMPLIWGGDMVLYAHGTVRAGREPGRIAEIVDEIDLGAFRQPDFFNLLGIGYAVVSRADTGWSRIGPAKRELRQLRRAVEDRVGEADAYYLVGASQGGLFATHLVEDRPDFFAGGLIACAPIGRIQRQVNYWGNLLVVFDYFFPGFGILRNLEVPRVPRRVRDNWEGPGGVEQQIRAALRADARATRQIVDVVNVPVDPSGGVPISESVLESLESAVFITNDAIATLGGNPFDNASRAYSGSDDDDALNAGVRRYGADAAARTLVADRYETSGILGVPLVSLHTKWDPIVPLFHARRYRKKVRQSGSTDLHSDIRVARYGHCNFTPAQAAVAFARLVLEAEGVALAGVEDALPDAAARAQYRALTRGLGP